jgi:hypothetical protein
LREHSSTGRAGRRLLTPALVIIALFVLAIAPAWAFAAPAPTTLTISAALKVVAYKAPATFTGALTDAQASPVTGYTVQLQTSFDQVAWTSVQDVAPIDGPYAYQYTASFVPARATWFRFFFAGDAAWAASQSLPILVKPRVSLSTPVVPASVHPGVKFLAYGFLKPRHASGAVYVKLRCYRKSGGAWVLKKVVSAPDVGYKTYTKYKARFSLGAGRWKLVARYAGTTKYATTSAADVLRTVK